MFEIYILIFPNNKVYIGKTKCLYKRLKQHELALCKGEKGWYKEASQFDWKDVEIIHFEVKNSLNLSYIEKELISSTPAERLYNTMYKVK